MSRFQACELCSIGLHRDCHNPDCGCCGDMDYDHPDPEEAGPDEYGREEDARLEQQLGPWRRRIA
jgi:hypothetical protein